MKYNRRHADIRLRLHPRVWALSIRPRSDGRGLVKHQQRNFGTIDKSEVLQTRASRAERTRAHRFPISVAECRAEQ